VTASSDRSARFLALHERDEPLLMPNPWDVGSAMLLASLGFEALATTSSGFAATLGRLDGDVSRDEAIAHSAALATAVDVPVSADLENCFGHTPEEVADTVRLAAATDLAGCSVEDFSGRSDGQIYELSQATERVAAAVEVAHSDGRGLVITARAENLLHGHGDLADTIARLEAYEAVGADVLFAPGLRSLGDVASVIASVGRPVNVLSWPGGPTVAQLAAIGVRRVSVGGSFSFVAMAAVADAARELREEGTFGYLERAKAGRALAATAFT
jgi:2-methylisocitrate lyase-like PEP mutase family enzyme